MHIYLLKHAFTASYRKYVQKSSAYVHMHVNAQQSDSPQESNINVSVHCKHSTCAMRHCTYLQKVPFLLKCPYCGDWRQCDAILSILSLMTSCRHATASCTSSSPHVLARWITRPFLPHRFEYELAEGIIFCKACLCSLPWKSRPFHSWGPLSQEALGWPIAIFWYFNLKPKASRHFLSILPALAAKCLDLSVALIVPEGMWKYWPTGA